MFDVPFSWDTQSCSIVTQLSPLLALCISHPLYIYQSLCCMSPKLYKFIVSQTWIHLLLFIIEIQKTLETHVSSWISILILIFLIASSAKVWTRRHNMGKSLNKVPQCLTAGASICPSSLTISSVVLYPQPCLSFLILISIVRGYWVRSRCKIIHKGLLLKFFLFFCLLQLW